eukprot:TRINITY_DN2303_c0_g1_i1.p3 TRINITY_DN2303_c0_g1~~TRINITY_DN2303_c0_g1_i1.p3  ORF type:complete len:238 (+),score=22.55 TRINITY_DN2303_c0_g1_i1:74-787(+)
MTSLYDISEKFSLPTYNKNGNKKNWHSKKGAQEFELENLRDVESPPPHEGAIIMQSLPTKIGNPAPIGLFAFGMTTMMLMFKDMGWTDPGFTNMVYGYGLFYGGLAQLIAGFAELYKGNTFAATAFTSYGAFWLGWFMISIYKTENDSFDTGFTLYFIQWGVFTACLFLITLHKKCNALRVVFGSLTLTFFLLAGGVHSETVNKIAGYVGFFCGFSAFYTAYAEIVLEETQVKLPGL